MHRHHPRSRVQLTLSVLRMDRAGRDRERHKRSAGRSVDRPAGRPAFQWPCKLVPAARLDYANRTCVLAFDWSARIPTQTYTRTHVRTHDAWPLCLSLRRPYAHDRGSEFTHTRRARLTLRIRIPMSPECPCVCTCAGILDSEHLLIPPRPPANRASSNARNGISEVFHRDRLSC